MYYMISFYKQILIVDCWKAILLQFGSFNENGKEESKIVLR